MSDDEIEVRDPVPMDDTTVLDGMPKSPSDQYGCAVIAMLGLGLFRLNQAKMLQIPFTCSPQACEYLIKRTKQRVRLEHVVDAFRVLVVNGEDDIFPPCPDRETYEGIWMLWCDWACGDLSRCYGNVTPPPYEVEMPWGKK